MAGGIDVSRQGGSRYFLLTDQVGSLRAVADTSGAIVKRIDYDSFGNIISDSNTAMTIPSGFAGGLHDRDTGLVRFGYRDYSPELGRFVAKDPIDFAGGDTNLYAYVASDPVNAVDPIGLSELIFDRSDGRLYFIPDVGRGPLKPVAFPASNRARNPDANPWLPEGNGPAPNGVFPLGAMRPPTHDTGSNEGLGPWFIPIKLPPRVPFTPRPGVGVHSGRASSWRGPGMAGTLGCVRTIEDAGYYFSVDPPTQITIQE